MSNLVAAKTGMLTDSEYADAIARAASAAHSYYDSDRLEMTDAEYDTLIDAITAYETAYPTKAVPHQLTTAVAGGSSGGGTVHHPTPMLSLDKSTTPEEINRFLASIGDAEVTVEPKMDGLAVRAVYENGTLVLLATRGDGVDGEDVTTQAVNSNGDPITGLPHTIPGFTGEIRGEVYMTDDDFDTSNEARVAAGEVVFANPRNATAGSLRRTDATYPVAMSFAAYGATWDGQPGSHYDSMSELTNLGVTTASSLMPVDNTTPTVNAKDVNARIETLATKRATLGFPIDGAVISVNKKADRARLGDGSRAPRWALAFKYPPEEVTSVLRDVEIAVGRTGRISLRGRIDPVSVGGTTITYATLHSPSWAEAQNLAIGSRVAVKRAGDVIPRIVGNLAGTNDTETTPWRTPDRCPNCGNTWDKTNLLWRCRTSGCGTAPAISYFASRDCADIDGMSDAIATALVSAGKVSNIADLYELSVDDIAEASLGTTERGATRIVGPLVAQKIHDQITASKSRPFDKILAGVGIRQTGRSMSRRLANHFGTLEAIRTATPEQLAEVDGIGPEKAAVIHQELQDKASILDRLVAAGVQTSTTSVTGNARQTSSGGSGATPAAAPLAGKNVVVTGAMTGALAAYKRGDMNDLIENAGGRASGSVSKNTSMLVCGEPGSSKYRTAERLGIPILTPDEFAALLGK